MLLNTSAPFPAVSCICFMPDKAKVAYISALTKSLCPDEICIRQISVINDICVTAHCAEFYKAAFSKNFCVYAFAAFKMKFVFRIIFVPGVAPPGTGSLFKAKRNNYFHQRQKNGILRVSAYPTDPENSTFLRKQF